MKKTLLQFLTCFLGGCLAVLLPSTLLADSTVNYSYDSLNRLVGVAYSDGTTVAYSYDAAGNRLSRVVSSSAQLPTLADISPAIGAVGFAVNVTLSGANFAAPATVDAGVGITVSNVIVNSPDSLSARFTIAANATIGSRSVKVATAGGTSNGFSFTVNALSAPGLTSLVPGAGTQGASVLLTITGTNFDSGLTVNAGIGISIGNINVTSATSATVTLAIDGSAAPGIRNVVVTTVAGTSNPILFTVTANHAPIAFDDSYKLDRAGTLNVPAPGVLGNDTDADSNPISAVQMTSPTHGTVSLHADGSFSYAHFGGDDISDSFTYKTVDGMADSNVATVTLNIQGLFVNQFQQTSSGFVAEFNRPIDGTALNLYNTESGGLGPADATLVGIGSGVVTGSLVVTGGGIVTFIRTGGILPPDTYTATLRSAANGFTSPAVGLLDGNRDGIAGDGFSATFTVANSSTAVVSIPDFLRGPGQVSNLSGTGIPVTLSDGAGVTQVDLVLKYDASLLLLSDVVPGAGLPPGSQVQPDFSSPGRLHITVTTAFPLNAGTVELVRIVGQVPATAPYGASQILAFTSLSLNGGAIPAIGDDGLHVATYIGDTTGNGNYSSQDAQRVLRVSAGLDSGFAAFPKIDPIVIADITGNGSLSSLDATRVLQEVVGIDRPEIPPLP